MSDIVFVQMPFAGVERPSLALGLFTAALRTAGLETEAIYANIQFAETIGLPAYMLMRMAAPTSLLGEWVFSASAFGSSARDLDASSDLARQFDIESAFIDLVTQGRGHTTLRELLDGLRRMATTFVQDSARDIVARRPKAVACTSMFDQHVASLALLQAVKALDPRILTVIGGANCAGPMGRATHHAFPAVDFTVTGEFDPFVVSFFRGLAEADGDAARVAPLPPNVLGPRHRDEAQAAGRRDAPLPPSAVLEDMNSAPVPDYDDYFEQLYSSPISPYVLTSIPLETSRGCWWGAKQHCTFCGLNGEGMAFRKKTPPRALSEIRGLTTRHGVFRWAAVDNIIDMSYFQSVLPALAGDRPPYNFFYETKANLKREHVQALAEAGCRFIQPGIESLHDETLRIMKKGTTACSNIQLLKYCLELGVTPAWSILCGFPGSDPAWVAEIAADLPMLFHLPPPNGTTPIRFDRFSPYHQRPAEYGLRLEPLPAYKGVYPLEEGVLEDLAYFFRETGGRTREITEFARESKRVTTRWRAEFWGQRRAELVIEWDDGDAVSIRDTRACATAGRHELRGAAALALRLLESPATPNGMLQRLQSAAKDPADGPGAAAGGGEVVGEAALMRAVTELVERRLVWRASAQYVALPTPPPRRAMPAESADAAVGKVNLAKYLIEQARFRVAFA